MFFSLHYSSFFSLLIQKHVIKIDSQLLGNSMKYIGICQQVFAKLFATGMVFFDGIKYLWIIFF
ncbi:MAG: hypothetical protein CMM15_05035 [Rhodospirillaceae bacterium]|nr:hypothetical protein [Rhodospirillaceae bacterium]